MSSRFQVVCDVYVPQSSFVKWTAHLSWQASDDTIFCLISWVEGSGRDEIMTFNLGQSHIDCYLVVRLWNDGTKTYDSTYIWINTPLGMDDGADYVWHVTGANAGYLEKVGGAFDASFVAVQLDYDSTTATIPVMIPIPLNDTGKVVVTARNDSTVPARLAINFTVKRPDGSTAQTVSEELGYIQPNATCLFTTHPTFVFDQAGIWKLAEMRLYVYNETTWVLVASLTATDMCTVSSTPAYDASIAERWLRYSGANFAFGTSVPLDTVANLQIKVLNSGSAAKIRLQSRVFNPSGAQVLYDDYESTSPVASGGTHTHNSPTFTLDVSGNWQVNILLSVWDGTQWLNVDRWPASGNGVLCSVGGALHIIQNLTVVYAKV
jgi:hypothetical protein